MAFFRDTPSWIASGCVFAPSASGSDVAGVSGAVSYTSLARLEGITAGEDSGGGPMYLDELARRYPGVPIALGLYTWWTRRRVPRGSRAHRRRAQGAAGDANGYFGDSRVQASPAIEQRWLDELGRDI